jgi:hypothetical protein
MAEGERISEMSRREPVAMMHSDGRDIFVAKRGPTGGAARPLASAASEIAEEWSI